MNFIKLILSELFFIRFSKKRTTLKEYRDLRVAFSRARVSHPSKDFSIGMPGHYIVHYHYGDEKIILGMSAGLPNTRLGYTSSILVEKYKSDAGNTVLEKEYETLMNQKSGIKILASGKTQFSQYDSYYIHSASDGPDEVEMISCLIQSKQKDVYYLLTAVSLLQDDELATNMGMMVQCFDSFEYN